MKHIKLKTYSQLSIWIGAIIIGISAVLYAQLINFVQEHYFAFSTHNPLIFCIITPFLFVLATDIVERFAPQAKGSGVPQVLEAIDLAVKTHDSPKAWHTSLVSFKTTIIKIISSCIGTFGGASIGREGPTVQIAASIFAATARVTKKWVPYLHLESYLISGAAAGVAAAFNTPLAGIAFAIEELVEGGIFHHFRQTVMLTVIISGIIAQALSGNYLYFGHHNVMRPGVIAVPQALLIGVLGGVMGGLFARFIAHSGMKRLPKKCWPRAFLCGAVCAVIAYFTHGASAGSGYEVTYQMLSSTNMEGVDIFFPIWKLISSVLSYLSGMAGGIFAPSLSIGAGIGMSVAKIFHFLNFKTCALIGMVAFFSGTVQAPLTAVIIVMEMTNEHILIVPFMISAFLAHGIGKIFMPTPVYRFMANKSKSDSKKQEYQTQEAKLPEEV